MKNIIFIMCMCCLLTHAFAQRTHTFSKTLNSYYAGDNHLARTTAVGDTSVLMNTKSNDTITLYQLGSGDSGYVTGTDVYGDMGFAELYNINGNDSGITVLGMMAQFGGTVNPNSTKSVVFKVWTVGLPNVISTNLIYSGTPFAVVDSAVFPITQLGIGMGTDVDTMKVFLFPDSTLIADSTAITLSYSFFAGYTITYNFDSLNGDTIGLASTLNGERDTPAMTTSIYVDLNLDTMYDTTVNVQNCTQWSDNNWYDNYTQNDSLFNDLIIYPIVQIDSPTEVRGITRRGLTIFGVYPNPAQSFTNVKFSLNSTQDVTIMIYDMNGKSYYSQQYSRLSFGEHTLQLPVTNLAPGNYSVLVKTGSGDGIATVFTVVR